MCPRPATRGRSSRGGSPARPTVRRTTPSARPPPRPQPRRCAPPPPCGARSAQRRPRPDRVPERVAVARAADAGADHQQGRAHDARRQEEEGARPGEADAHAGEARAREHEGGGAEGEEGEEGGARARAEGAGGGQAREGPGARGEEGGEGGEEAAAQEAAQPVHVLHARRARGGGRSLGPRCGRRRHSFDYGFFRRPKKP